MTDSDGLSACISPNGVVAFQYRYRWEGKPVRLTIGHYPALSLKNARIIVSDMRNLYKKGLNLKIYFSKDEGEATLYSINFKMHGKTEKGAYYSCLLLGRWMHLEVY